MDVFGFEIKRKKTPSQTVGSVVAPSADDGSTIVNSAAAYYGCLLYTSDAADE